MGKRMAGAMAGKSLGGGWEMAGRWPGDGGEIVGKRLGNGGAGADGACLHAVDLLVTEHQNGGAP